MCKATSRDSRNKYEQHQKSSRELQTSKTTYPLFSLDIYHTGSPSPFPQCYSIFPMPLRRLSIPRNDCW